MSTFKHIQKYAVAMIEHYGGGQKGVRALAEAVDANESTVYRWKGGGKAPAALFAKVKALYDAGGVKAQNGRRPSKRATVLQTDDAKQLLADLAERHGSMAEVSRAEYDGAISPSALSMALKSKVPITQVVYNRIMRANRLLHVPPKQPDVSKPDVQQATDLWGQAAAEMIGLEPAPIPDPVAVRTFDSHVPSEAAVDLLRGNALLISLVEQKRDELYATMAKVEEDIQRAEETLAFLKS